MDVTEITRLHNVVAKCFKEYEQRIGRLPPVEVLNELRYALRAMVEIRLPTAFVIGWLASNLWPI